NAYRILPGTITFSKPVKLTMSFAQDDLSNSLPEATAIASQNAKGVWETTANEQIDVVKKTVTGYYSKFTDMALFKRLILVPELAFVDPGKSIHLAVITTMELESQDLSFPPLGPVKDSLAASIKSWSLAGSGSLSSNGSQADYTAPAEMPARNPVAVTATLNTKGSNVYKLVSNIYIGKEGVTFRIDNGPWRNGQSYEGATTQMGFTQLQAGPVVNGTPMGAVTLRWSGYTLLTQAPWSLTFPSFSYNDGRSTDNYWQFYSTGNNLVPSPGGITFFNYGSPGEYITGIFILEKAGRSYAGAYGATLWDIHKIDGFFKVKRAN
ncbi:MAG TPA: hypothetical protein VNS32_10550, partial [Flavisolibacter sp.]|nr:hypothetical protein [Flavisolibacter sp.]